MSIENNKNTNNTEIDESLYSRQLYVLGHDAMKTMAQSNVLISGMNGLGVEIAKNIVLSGVKSVTIHDTKNATFHDLASQFYLEEKNIGLNRATSILEKLSELNMYVNLAVLEPIKLTEEIIKPYNVVILCDSTLDEQLTVNKWARDNDIKYIHTSTKGLFGQIFCDFGNNFIINDIDGEDPLTSIISSIDSEGIIFCTETSPHGLTNDDVVEIIEVDGLNINGGPYNIKVLSPTSLKILDKSFEGTYTSGGIIKQIKIPKAINFLSLEDAIKNPEYVLTDFANFERPNDVHIAFQTLELYKNKYNEYPKAWNNEDANKFFELALTITSEIHENIIRLFAKICCGNIGPIQSVIGSITSQEIIKACSNKYNPIHQWLYFDAIDCLSDDIINESDCIVNQSRYDGLVSIFGNDFSNKIMDQNWFVVGAGAIGCELLKNFAMIGLGCGNGNVTITDMDTIEKSNLNRQFLFRNSDIGKAKSTSAANAIKKMNPDFNITPQLNKVCPENEKFYNSSFYNNLDGVVNALDNVQARLYMDKQCIQNGKPLLESGTLGTKGNTQVVIPNLTESYGSSQDPPEKSIPVCTIKNFPNSIEHTIQWAREEFEGLFCRGPNNTLLYLKDSTSINKLSPADKNVMIDDVNYFLIDAIPNDFDDCLKIALTYWYKKYRDEIYQLIDKFPADTLTTSGLPFWSSGKRCPTISEFDSNNITHTNYIWAFSNLWANIYNISNRKSYEDMIVFINEQPIPALIVNSDLHFSVTDEEEKNKPIQDKDGCSLPDIDDFIKLSLVPQEFEKDDDTNFHIDFITASSNMRALNYKIDIVSNHKTKGIAGKIIPAIATTTSLVAGLVTLEMLKIIQGHNSIEKFKSSFVNLALPYFGFADPIEASKYKFADKDYTLWDYIEIPSELTLGQFKDFFKEKYNVEISTITHDVIMLYAFFLPNKNNDKLISDIIKMKTKKSIETDMVLLTVIADDDDGEEINIPNIKYYLRKNETINITN